MKQTILAATALALLSACSSEAPPSGDMAGEASETDMVAEAPAAMAALPAQEATETAAAQPPAPPAEIEGITNKRLSFAPGASSAAVQGSITGYETIDYLLNVKAGQPMNISMATKHTAAYFNLLEPGETDVATFIGSTSGNQFEGVAQKSGDYRIRVYMMRSAARRNERADYLLEAIVSP